MAIAVKVRLNAMLRKYSPTVGQGTFELSLPENSCIEDAMRELGLAREHVELATINLKYAGLSQSLHEGDEVVLFPRLPIGG